MTRMNFCCLCFLMSKKLQSVGITRRAGTIASFLTENVDGVPLATSAQNVARNSKNERRYHKLMPRQNDSPATIKVVGADSARGLNHRRSFYRCVRLSRHSDALSSLTRTRGYWFITIGVTGNHRSSRLIIRVRLP